MNLEILKVIYKLITFSWDKRTFLYHSQLVIKREIGIILLALNGLEKTSQLFCVISLFMQSQTDAVMLRSGGGCHLLQDSFSLFFILSECSNLWHWLHVCAHCHCCRMKSGNDQMPP